ncbi:MAG TPA: hypothetical protein VFP12_01415 [Allosphingosinicella sp.]|nr:hypothetical protein [Allosphingosinicella sp.]
MSNGRKSVLGTFAASILLAASVAAAPAMAKKPPPPPPPPPPGEWDGCSPWGPVIYGVDCCDYPELIVPCEGLPAEPALRPEQGSTEAVGQ